MHLLLSNFENRQFLIANPSDYEETIEPPPAGKLFDAELSRTKQQQSKRNYGQRK